MIATNKQNNFTSFSQVIEKDSDILKDIIENFDSDLKYYISTHNDLLENVQADILDWANETRNDVEFESIKYFVTEKLFLDKLRKLSPDDFFSDIVNIEEQYNSIESVQKKFDMQKYLQLCNSDIKKIKDSEEETEHSEEETEHSEEETEHSEEETEHSEEEIKAKKIELKYFNLLLESLIKNLNACKSEEESEYSEEETKAKKIELKYFNSLLESLIKNLHARKSEENAKKIELLKQSYFDACLKALIENFNARKSAFEQKLIDEKRQKFLKELYEKIENFKKLEECLQPFIDDLGHGYLWDMSNAPFRNLGFDILKKYASLLKNDKALQEFAELLGKQSITSQEIEKKIIEETVVKSEYHPKPAQSGNIVGFEYSNEISRVLPSETALLTDPDLENLFYLRFVEKQLLSYRYSQNVLVNYNETQQKEIEVSKSEDLTGPIIICVDTSGSMQGTPEQTAKIATFALAKIAIRQHRKCFLISFSTGIETLDMSDFKKSNALELLVNFLNKSFNGGTDATPALAECLRQLKTENYQNADVLMISDFVMGNLPENLVSQIKAEQEKDTFFYSLVIGQSENNKVIEYFNDNITYNPYDESSRQEFYKKIRQIAVKRKKS